MSEERLRALTEEVGRDLALTEVPARAWVKPPAREDQWDVVVAGGGLSGLTIAFGLKRKGVGRVKIIDAAPRGLEGPWLTTARMRTLRSPKTLSGLDFGTPSLTYRAWHEARYGAADFAGLTFVRRLDWTAYLKWFREAAGLAVENDCRLTGIGPEGEGLALEVAGRGGARTIHCRELVLATGIGGTGGPAIPEAVRRGLPRERYTHSDEAFDCAALRGRDVAVLGAASSAFDFALAALDAGARRVRLLMRRTELPVTEVLDWSNFPGFLENFAELDDLWRFRFTERMIAFSNPPTQECYDRTMADPRFSLIGGVEVADVTLEGGRIVLAAGDGQSFSADHLLLGTGYAVGLALRPELAPFAGEVALWRDRFAPPPGREASPVLDYPYLGRAFEFLEREPGAAPFLRHIHLFTNGAVPSLGPVCNGVTGLKYGAPRMVRGILHALFADDIAYHYDALDRFDTAHFAPAKTGSAV